MHSLSLTNWNVLSIKGPDTTDFLNRLTTVAVNRLEQNVVTGGFLLKATGKVIAFFKLLYLTRDTNHHETLLIVAPGSEHSARDCFENLHFMENLEITERKDLTYCRVLCDKLPNLPFIENTMDKIVEKVVHHFSEFNSYGWIENEWNINLWRDQSNQTDRTFNYDIGLLVSSQTELEFSKVFSADPRFLSRTPEPADLSRSLNAFRILSGKPTAPNEINTDVLPLEVAMASAVHEGKGCYPGQEVIERIRTMGQAPRKLIAFRAQCLNLNQKHLDVYNENMQNIGTAIITSMAAHPLHEHEVVGLALVKKNLIATEVVFHLDGKPVDTKVLD